MARTDRRLPHNAPGAFYVDSTCIDCDTCRWMAPGTFRRRAEQASVHTQPASAEERRRAAMALVSCPTSSIGVAPDDADARAAVEDAATALPDEIAPGVFHCGHHARSSFGAASYLVVRPEGNVLIDSPRFAAPLVRRIEALGGVRTMFLTHCDDVADHARFRAHFGCDRVLHEGDLTPDTKDVEIVLRGEGDVRLAADLLAIPTPGHTEGSACLLVADRYLFTGDHLAWSASLANLYAFRTACWFDWDVQTESMRRLAAHQFEWVLPGHGRRCTFPADEMQRRLGECIRWMERPAPDPED